MNNKLFNILFFSILVTIGLNTAYGDRELDLNLQSAARDGNYAMVQTLLSKDANPNSTQIGPELPLVWAVRNRFDNIVELLLKKGANPNEGNISGYHALTWAVHHRNYKIAQMLLKKGANPNAGNTSPVKLATIFRDNIMLTLLKTKQFDYDSTVVKGS